MNPPPPPAVSHRSAAGEWKQVLREAVRDPDELIDLLGLPESLRGPARAAAGAFPLVVPRPFLDRMGRGDPADPLLRQVLPLGAELVRSPEGYSQDPLGEGQATKAPGMLHKYRGRALLVVAGVCAVACRYCFRRHFPYDESPRGLDAWEPALRELAADPTVEEVILSGGDPLMRSDGWLAELVERLAGIPHLRRIRVHTRLPIVIPQRVNDELLGWLATSRLAPTVVVHANHPNELDGACQDALTRMVRAGIPVLNQSVLLRGINDELAVLEELSRRLLDARVMPYYLHQLDPVVGAAHFEVEVAQGLELVAGLRERLPGFGVPRYVRELAGAAHKTEIVS